MAKGNTQTNTRTDVMKKSKKKAVLTEVTNQKNFQGKNANRTSSLSSKIL